MPRQILIDENTVSDVETEPMTYLEEHHPAFVAELLALAERIDEDD